MAHWTIYLPKRNASCYSMCIIPSLISNKYFYLKHLYSVTRLFQLLMLSRCLWSFTVFLVSSQLSSWSKLLLLVHKLIILKTLLVSFCIATVLRDHLLRSMQWYCSYKFLEMWISLPQFSINWYAYTLVCKYIYMCVYFFFWKVCFPTSETS